MRLIEVTTPVPKLTFYNGTTDHYKGQTDGILWAYDKTKYPTGFDLKQPQKGIGVYGFIDWSMYDGDILIKFIKVDKRFRRQGIGTMLYRQLEQFAEEHNATIHWGSTSSDGTKFKQSIDEIRQIDDFTPMSIENNLTRRPELRDKTKHVTNFVTADQFVPIELKAKAWPLDSFELNTFIFVDSLGNIVGKAIVSADEKIQGSIKDKFIQLWRVTSIRILPKYQKQGIGNSFYSFLLDHNYILVSDYEHTKASRANWKKLAAKYKAFLLTRNDTGGFNKPKKITADELDQAYEYTPNYTMTAQTGLKNARIILKR